MEHTTHRRGAPRPAPADPETRYHLTDKALRVLDDASTENPSPTSNAAGADQPASQEPEADR